MSRIDHNMFNAQTEKRELDAALSEYRHNWPRFLREDLGITLAQIRSLDTSILMAVILLHLDEKIGRVLNDHELRLRALEHAAERSSVLLVTTPTKE